MTTKHHTMVLRASFFSPIRSISTSKGLDNNFLLTLLSTLFTNHRLLLFPLKFDLFA